MIAIWWAVTFLNKEFFSKFQKFLSSMIFFFPKAIPCFMLFCAFLGFASSPKLGRFGISHRSSYAYSLRLNIQTKTISSTVQFLGIALFSPNLFSSECSPTTCHSAMRTRTRIIPPRELHGGSKKIDEEFRSSLIIVVVVI